jgi:uncharacterized RDD family membrane protein YckC
VNGFAHAAAPPIAGPALDNKRVAAALIDLLVLALVAVLLGTLSGAYTNGARLVTVAWVLYYYFALELLTGQTLGKKLMGLRVAQPDGSPPELRQIAVRTVLRLVDGLGVYLVGLITMLATGKRRQRLGDLAAGTIVTTAEVESRDLADLETLVEPDAPVVPLHQPDETPAAAPVPTPPAPAAEREPPPFEPYTVPEPPAPPPEPAPVEEPPPAAAEPHIELVPDPPADGEKPRIQIVSPIDLVMADDEQEGHDVPPPSPPRSA